MPHIVNVGSIAEACEAMRDSDGSAKFLGGGSALVLLLRMGLVAPSQLIALRRVADVPGWNDIDVDSQGHIRIGGGVSLERVSRSPLVRKAVPGLAAAASVVGNLRIRNAATVGGLMAEADYASDPPSVLVSVGASVLITNGLESREQPASKFLEDFFTTTLAEDEVVTGISIPVNELTQSSIYRKFCARAAEDRPCVGTAVAASLDADVVTELEVVIGGVAGVPQRLTEITNGYRGKRLTPAVAADIAEAYVEAIDPIEDVRGTPWYRKQVMRAEIVRGITSYISVAASS